MHLQAQKQLVQPDHVLFRFEKSMEFGAGEARSSRSPASRPVQRALLTPRVIHGPSDRCSKATLRAACELRQEEAGAETPAEFAWG